VAAPEQLAKVAAMDLGSNTFRLLVAHTDGDSRPVPTRKEQVITRLGGGFDREGGRISGQAIQRAEKALEFFARIIGEQKADSVMAAATEIVRRASNGPDFLGRASRILGAEVSVLSPEMEAVLALKGILAYTSPLKAPAVTLDIGGGSTEMALTEGEEPADWISMRLGVVDLSERLLGDRDPPTTEALARCEKEIAASLAEAADRFARHFRPGLLIGTGGTATSLAVIDLELNEYDEEAVQNHIIGRRRIRELESRLCSLPFDERADIFPLGGGREDVIIPGAMITRVAMELFDIQEMMISDSGLLEGLAMAGARKLRKEVKEA